LRGFARALNAVSADAGFTVREFVSRARIRVRQDSRELWSGRVGRLVPGRSAHIPSGWTGRVDPTGGPVIVAVK
jgi:hypothetical protein